MPGSANTTAKWGDLGTRIASAVVLLAVTAAALWLGSDASSFTLGHALAVDAAQEWADTVIRAERGGAR